MRTVATRYPLVIYFFSASLITWGLLSPLVLQATGQIHDVVPPVWHYLGALGPVGAAFLVTGLTSGKTGVSELLRRVFHWRIGATWLAVALLSPAVVYFVAGGVIQLTTGTGPALARFGLSSEFPSLGVLGMWCFHTFTYGFGEEVGWRGFALPRLQASYSALTATLLLSVLWGVWHVPMFFYRFGYLGVAGTIGFFVGLFAGGIVLTWLYNSTGGSILAVGLWHGAWNTAMAADISKGVMEAVMSTVVILAAILIVAFLGPASLSRARRETSPI